MLQTFLTQESPEYNFVILLSQALKIQPFSEVRRMTLEGLVGSEGFTNEQKLSIKNIALQMDSGAFPHQVNHVLMKIINTSWDSDTENMGVQALIPEQRAGILEAIMQVCKYIISEESIRLNQLTALPTVLPEGWADPEPEPEPEVPVEPPTEPENPEPPPEDPEP